MVKVVGIEGRPVCTGKICFCLLSDMAFPNFNCFVKTKKIFALEKSKGHALLNMIESY